jgi:O-antigen/teichoic acid export membrane protein
MYTLNLTVDVLLLKQFSDIEILGQYSLAKNISSLFIFIPAGISTVLMPRVASLPEEKHKKLLIQSLDLSLLISVGILAVILLFGEWAVRQFFGADYLSSPTTVLVLSIAMIVLGIHGIFSSFQVGKGRANWETISRFAFLMVSVAIGWWSIPVYAGLGAAISMLAGGISGMIAYGVLYFLEWRSA